ncbi:MAG: cyclohydrolase, partial [Gaiellaceae bacterium]|nr:cyclohydrolase [Gaiellaceae bacterium]
AALSDTLESYPQLEDGDFLFSRQVNLETIHDHDVLAERHGTVGELRGELADGVHLTRHTDLRDWLRSA